MSNELNNLKVKALKTLLEQTRETIRVFKQFEKCDYDMAITLESIWSTEEDKLLGMRKMYKNLFNETAPIGIIELRKAIAEIEFI